MIFIKTFALLCLFLFSVLIGCFIHSFLFPLVSVVMPTYNRAHLLSRSINSILNQSYPYFELIIVDDGSTDNSVQLITDFMKKDRRIRLIRHEKNCGVACTRNTGNDAARGKYIAVMDSDDASYPERLKKQVAFLNTHPNVTVITTNKMFDTRPSYRSADPWEILYHLHFDNVVGNPENMFRRDFVRKNNIRYNPLYHAAEDYDFWKQIVFAGGTIHRLEDILIRCYAQSDHKTDYLHKMRQTRAQVSNEFLKRYGIDWSGSKTITCDLLQQMAQNADRARLLPVDFLNLKIIEKCPEK